MSIDPSVMKELQKSSSKQINDIFHKLGLSPSKQQKPETIETETNVTTIEIR